MKTSLLRKLAVSSVLLFAFTASSAHAQTSLSAGITEGGAIGDGQARVWMYNVPAGNYLAIGRVSYELNSEAALVGMTCSLKRGQTDEFWDIQEASVTGDAQGGQTVEGEITLLGQIPLPTDGTIGIRCYADGAGARVVRDVRLELVAVRRLAELTQVDTSGPAIQQDQRGLGGVDRRRRN